MEEVSRNGTLIIKSSMPSSSKQGQKRRLGGVAVCVCDRTGGGPVVWRNWRTGRAFGPVLPSAIEPGEDQCDTTETTAQFDGAGGHLWAHAVCSHGTANPRLFEIATRATSPNKYENRGGRARQHNDDPAPIPLLDEQEFIIAPHFVDAGREVEECEVDASEIQPLLDFEEAKMQHGDICARILKDFGDAMTRLKDYTRAVSYYEAALHRVSSQISLGCTIVLKCQGHAVLAEVDCMEDDTDTLDLTLLSGEEKTIHRRDVILVVWEEDKEMLQVKILLNLSRCLLKLASIDKTAGTVVNANEHKLKQHNRQEYYKLASIRGCTAAISLCDHHGGSSNAIAADLEAKGRLVRARAFLWLARVPNALVDAKKVSTLNPNSREAEALVREIRAFQSHSKAVDRKLSKAVAKLVHSATSSSGEEDMEGMGQQSVSAGAVSRDRERPTRGLIPFLVLPVLAVVLAHFGLTAMNKSSE
ncbi:hypothetical protein THAOC_29489 [Thalassiosira oceanica]|uniref:Uncharacterized protein n=1 Tax=Thalassiosira oceanica TaxID=159749 RepID=K0RR24_THAOC|nr:hypothetical protein THAOC_29489 [Thalassiosira oceanica]|eukprot:EJK51341.1 hypothetical protein THAOC_29489 [Thalassiosira oceanica]